MGHKSSSADLRSEVAIFHRQRQFIVVFRGTTAQQKKATAQLFSNKKSKALVPLTLAEQAASPSSSSDHRVYACFKEVYIQLEERVVQQLDRLVDENPFCDIAFTGSSFGAGIAQIAAVRYATARSAVRVSCYSFGSTRVGDLGFANLANSLPNLKVVRADYKNDPACNFAPTSNGYHIGHLVSINNNRPSFSKKEIPQPTNLIISAYKFDKGDNTTRKNNLKFVQPRRKKRSIEDYVAILEEIQRRGTSWVNDYEGENTGAGVRGNDNEIRKLS